MRLDLQQRASLIDAMRGLTLSQIDRIIDRTPADDGSLTLDDTATAAGIRQSTLMSSTDLELVRTESGLDWLAGFEEFKRWIAIRRASLDGAGTQAFGIQPARGVLLTGVPGCGTSFAIKAMARDWSVPLLRLDADRLFNKFVGSTEGNLRQAFSIIESLAPSILWIDEIEKAFATSGPSESGGGLSFSLVGALAT